MKGTVIYLQDVTFQVEIPPDKQFHIPDALDYMWEATNPDSGNLTIRNMNKMGAQLRSSMVGDIFVVNHRYFMVDRCGFNEINEIVSIQIQHLGSREVGMGYDWLVKKHGFPKGPMFIHTA